MKRSVPWLGLAAALFYTMPASAQESCSSWNTRGFFKESTVREVASCLAAGAEVMARNEYGGLTPLHSAARSNASPDVIAFGEATYHVRYASDIESGTLFRHFKRRPAAWP